MRWWRRPMLCTNWQWYVIVINSWTETENRRNLYHTVRFGLTRAVWRLWIFSCNSVGNIARCVCKRTKPTVSSDTLTFDNGYKAAVAEELAAKYSIEFNASPSGGNGPVSINQVDNVNQVKTLSKKKYSTNKGIVSSGNAINSNKSCYRCGGNHHEQTCKYINESRHLCNKTGHIARMCRAKQKSRRKSVTHVSDGEEADNDETLTLLGVYSVDADINDASGCRGNLPWAMRLSLWSWTQGLRSPLSQKAHTEASCLNTHYKHQTSLWSRIHSSDVRKTTVHALSRGGMWWATSSARKRLVADDQAGLEEHFQCDVRKNV